MITIKNTGAQSMTWYVLPKFSVNISQAMAQGTLPPSGEATYNPPTSVNILFSTNQVAAVCGAGQSSTVVYFQTAFGTWCTVS